MMEMVQITAGLVPNTMVEIVEKTSALAHHTFCNWFKDNFNDISECYLATYPENGHNTKL